MHYDQIRIHRIVLKRERPQSDRLLFKMTYSSFITYTIAIASSAGRLEPQCTLSSVDSERYCLIAAITTA